MRRRSQGTAETGNQAFNKRQVAGASPADVRFIRTNQMPGKTAHGGHLPEPRHKGRSRQGRLEPNS